MNQINKQTSNILYLASQSLARQNLLKLAGIQFETISHGSTEEVLPHFTDFAQIVQSIAHDKMKHATLPEKAQELPEVFVLTADTLVRTTKTNQILGKPKDKQDAFRMLDLHCAEPVEVITAVCIQKRAWRSQNWAILDEKTIISTSIVDFWVKKEDQEWYLEVEPGILQSSGAAIIDGFGLIFLKSLQGSFTSVSGLPLYEVRQELKNMGFFKVC